MNLDCYEFYLWTLGALDEDLAPRRSLRTFLPEEVYYP